jgi:hypothetical protein
MRDVSSPAEALEPAARNINSAPAAVIDQKHPPWLMYLEVPDLGFQPLQLFSRALGKSSDFQSMIDGFEAGGTTAPPVARDVLRTAIDAAIEEAFSRPDSCRRFCRPANSLQTK